MQRNHPVLPFVAVTIGIATFGVMDALMKSASIQAGVYSAMLVRSLMGAGLVLPIWRLGGGAWPARAVLKLHALRGAVTAGMATTFFWGLVRIPMAEGMALSFIAPLIALYLAAAVLGETIGRAAILASVMGVLGVIVIAAARFGEQGFGTDAGWGIAAILCSAVLYAWNLILQRQQALLSDPREVALFQNLFVALVLAGAAPWLFSMPGPRAMADIFGGAVLTVISLMLLSWGYARAEAQALVPIEYTAFIWAALMGWLMFGEAVTVPTLAGAALIVAGCLIAARRKTA